MEHTGNQNEGCLFCDILRGMEPGKIIAQDDDRQFALIQDIHPEGFIHWLAVPYAHIDSIEDLQQGDRAHFLELVEFAITQTRARTADFPQLQNGFTVKFHLGAFETIPHAKLHVLSVE